MNRGSAARQCISSGRFPAFEPFTEPTAQAPGFRFEQELFATGITRIAGVDEAGRGPLAGPVVAAAVILPFPCPIAGIDDSKRLTPKKRARLYDEIFALAPAVSIGQSDVATIDRVNILQAARLAMRQAVCGLSLAPEYVLVDAVTIPGIDCPQRPIIHGDALSLSIAAASIIAKVTRDRIMEAMDRQYPQYGFAEHKGYPTRKHQESIERYGICPEHRRSFAPVRAALEQGKILHLPLPENADAG